MPCYCAVTFTTAVDVFRSAAAIIRIRGSVTEYSANSRMTHLPFMRTECIRYSPTTARSS